MTESKLFLSSCSRRELSRRRGHPRYAAVTGRLIYAALTTLAFVVVCGGAFIAGRGGI